MGGLGDKTRGVDIIQYLSKQISDTFKKSQLRETLSRHPYWLHIPLKTVVTNFQYLENHFLINDILPNSPLLLYPL